MIQTFIHIDDLRFYAYHGVGEQERVVGNEFTVQLRLKADLSRAMQSDDVADTVSYADVCQSVKEEMETSSRLLEHVAGRIVRRLRQDFPALEEIHLKLSKRNPPMGADVDSAGVEVLWKR